MSKNNFILFFVIFFVASFLLGVIYLVGQQILRTMANDPQIQISEDLVAALNSGVAIDSLVAGHVDIAASLAPYVVIFNQAGEPINGNGYLNGTWPGMPKGIFEYVDGNGEDRITWQPQAGVRSATIINKYNDGYVLVGRSLREVEVREAKLFQLVAVAWLILTVSFILVSILFVSQIKKNNK